MRVAIFGHSYVRDLKQLGFSHLIFEDFDVPVDYFDFPGSGFHDFILNPSLLDKLVIYNPTVIVIFLGGNDLKVNLDLDIVKHNCSQFYSVLRLRLPNSVFITSQVEYRHLKSTNRHGTPDLELYRRLANNFNKWIARQKFKDRLLIVNGSDKLGDSKFFKSDGVHLNRQGLELLFDLMYKCLSHFVVSTSN